MAISTSAGAGNNAVAIGNAAGAYGDDSIAISSGASAAKYAVSVGKNANAWKEDSIVFGFNSKSGSDHGIMGWDPLSANIGQDYTTPTWTSTNNAVSFGRAEERDEDGNVTLTQITRQINNVAAGTLDTDVVNVAQLKSAIKSFEYNAGKWHDYDVNVPTEEIMSDTNYDNTGAQKGKRAMAAGFSATANGDDSMALGFATANGTESVAIGKGANVIGVKAVGFGANQSIGLSSMAFGQNNTAGTPADKNGAYTLQYNGDKVKETVMADAAMHEAYVDSGKTFNVTFKTEDKADQHLLVLKTKDNKPVVLASDGKLYNVTWDGSRYVQGDEAADRTTDDLVTHNYNTDGATFTGAYSTAFGKDNVASGTASLAFGGEAIKVNGPTGNKATGVNSVAFGNSTLASGQDTVAFGDRAKATNDEAVAFGQDTLASAARATAFGESSTASGQTATAFGYHTTASGTGATALGNKSQATGMYSMAWGGGDRHLKDEQGNELKDDQGKPVKTGPIASGLYSTAFGSGTQATAENATAFGELSNATGKNATAFGKESTASGENTLAALGGTAEGVNSTAIGVGATAKLDGSIALGDGALADTKSGIEGYDPMGTGSVSTDESATWKSTKNALSVGDADKNVTRQITGVAAGREDTDAVNVAQLKKMGEYASKHTLVTVNETKTEAPKDANGYTDEYDTAGGNLSIRANTENGQNTFNIKMNDQIGLGQKGDPGTPGKDGVDGKVTITQGDGSQVIIGKDGKDGKNGISIKGADGKDGISITGPTGEPGKDGNDGHIGIAGKDGKDAVAINGTDGVGTIGLAGKDGTKGADGKDGIGITTIRTEYVTRPGVDGEDGKDGITRIIYKDPDGKDHDVATLDDGLKFTGNNSTTINHNKLDTTVHVVGEGTDSDLTKFKSAGGNIAVEANGKDDNDSTLTIKLNKDVNLGGDGSLTVGGSGGDSIVIKQYNDGDLKDNKGGDVKGGDYITGLDNRTWNVDDPTYVSGRAATEDELKQAGDQINTKIENVKNSVTNVDQGGGFGLQDEKTGKVSQDLGTNIQVIGDGKRTYETKTVDGKEVKVIKDVTDSNITTEVVELEDGTKAVKVALSDDVNIGGNDGKDGHIGVNGKDGRPGADGKDAVSINAIGKDGEDGADGQIGVNGKDGTTIIIGKDAVPGKDGKDGLNGISIKGDDGKDGLSGVTIVGPQGSNGRDGYDGIDGKIGISGKDGKDAVSISGKDGIGQIGLTGKDGADGKTITTTISTLGPNGTNGKDGVPGVDGKDGITRIQYNDGTNTQTVATLNDGMKFTGNNSDKVNHNKLNTTVNVVGEGTGKDLSNFKSAGGNIAVEANGGDDDQSTLTVKLNKDVNLGGDGSLTVGGDTKNGDAIVIKNHQDGDLTDNKGGKVEGGDYITGLDNRTWNVDDPTYVSGRAATEDELKQAGDQINTKITNVENKITNITDADKGGGFGLQDEHTGKVSQNLGTNIQIIGDGTRTYKDDGKGGKVIDTVTDSNITTEVVTLEDGTKAVEVALSDNVNLGGKGKDGKDGKDGSIGVNGKNGENGVTITAKGEKGADGKDGAVGDIGVKGLDGKDGVSINGKDGISMQGEAGKNGISIKGDPGDDGKPGKDGISIKGPSGENGDNGHIGISGKDGKDAVALDGKDGVGHIGLTGPAGKDGKNASADISVKNGSNGVDGTDGNNGKDGMDRITYVDHNEVTHEVATLDDGLNFTGNNTDTTNHHKLNTLVKVQGEGTGTDLSNFKSAAGNIAVEADGKDTLTIKLNKDLGGLNSVTTNNAYIGGNTVINNNGITTNKVVVGNTTVTNNSITVNNGTNIDMGDNQIHNVKAGTAPTDAVNVSQLGESNTTMSNRINRLGDQIDRVGAHASAMAALHPLDFDPDEKLDFAAGFGNYKGEHAAAIGAFYRPNEDTMFSLGGSVGGGDNMVNVGVSFKLGQHNHVSVSRVALAKEVLELRKELENVKSYLADQAAGNTLDLSKIQLFPDTPENHWAYDYVATMAGNGVLEGYPDGYFKGNRNMTRYEMAAVLYRMMQNGAKLSARALTEFAPELDRIRVDTITKDGRGVPHIQRVRTVKGRE